MGVAVDLHHNPPVPWLAAQALTFEIAELVLLGRPMEGDMAAAWQLWLQGFEGVVPVALPGTALSRGLQGRAQLCDLLSKARAAHRGKSGARNLQAVHSKSGPAVICCFPKFVFAFSSCRHLVHDELHKTRSICVQRNA